MSNQRFEKQRQFLQNRLSPEGYAGLHLTIGVLVVLLAAWWFGAIAENLSPDNPLVLFDQRVAVWFHQHATTTLTHVAKAITFFGSVLGLTILSVAVALVFIVSRAWFNLLVFAAMMTGESLLNVLLKHLFHRHRPVLENPLVTLTSYGFPSGHTMGVTVLFGLLAEFTVSDSNASAGSQNSRGNNSERTMHQGMDCFSRLPSELSNRPFCLARGDVCGYKDST